MAAPLVFLAKAVVVDALQDKKKRKKIVAVIAGLLVINVMAVYGGIVLVTGIATSILSIQGELPEGYCAPDFDENGNEIPGEDWYAADTSSPDGAGTGTETGAGTTTAPVSSGRVVMPVPEGRYRLASPYGFRQHPITHQQKLHEGMDFSAIPKGSLDIPIVAVADGIVKQTGEVAGFGQWVTIEHNMNGSIYVTVYGHVQVGSQTVKPGDVVTAGQKIALMGNEGLSSGVHVHLELWTPVYGSAAGGKSLDPAPWLESSGATAITEALDGSGLVAACGKAISGGPAGAGPWGGHENGRIPAEEMCSPATFPGHLLRCDAASAAEALNVAFKTQFGRDLLITDSYRSYEAQVKCREEKGNWCATPGTSNHGWGLAVDLGGGINVFSAPEHKWMIANAAAYGWTHPAWAGISGAKPEPWHWEYIGVAGGVGAAGDGKTPDSAKALAQAKIAAYGWNGTEFSQCLVPLWQKESGWNYQAANGASSARGIPQAMMSAHFGSGWKTDAGAQAWLNSPDQQITWGLDYIKGRYGTPCGAWGHSQKTGWY